MAAKNKTVANQASATEFMKGVEDERKRKDSRALAKMMREITGKNAKMWGSSIVGFGTYHYRYESGREGDFMITGFSPRKQNLTVYVMNGFEPYRAQLKRLGKHKLGKSCLYLKSLDDVDLEVLRGILEHSVADMRKRYECS